MDDWNTEDQALSDSLIGVGPSDADPIRMPKFAVRTIKNSRVKVAGRTFVSETPLPDHLQVRAVFGLYYTGGKLDSTIVLWGSLAMRKARNMEEFSKVWDENPFCIDGVFEYQWWREETSK